MISEKCVKSFEINGKIFEINENISVRTVQNELLDGLKVHFGRSKINFKPSKTKLFSVISKLSLMITELLSVISERFSVKSFKKYNIKRLQYKARHGNILQS